MKIGFRIGGELANRSFPEICRWVKAAGIEAVDTNTLDAAKAAAANEDGGFGVTQGSGIVAIELEDYRYWKDAAAQEAGVRRAAKHLAKFVR